MEQVLTKLESEIDRTPHDDFDRGWNAALRLAIREIKAAQQSVQQDGVKVCRCKRVGNRWKESQRCEIHSLARR